uniref:G-protein coupled receptors family 1 profile domain-containing protein n=1 Tax=Romanomermis culicivorax TaxID=13658 RepID=A0A915JCV7_ROMCU
MPRRCESLSFYLLQTPPNRSTYNNATTEFNGEYFPFLKNLSTSYLSVHGYICIFLCVFGILTNLLNFVILRRRDMRTSVNVVLSQIAICDLATMISYLVFVSYFYIWSWDPDCLYRGYSKNWMNFILFHSSWSVLMHTTSIWLVVLLALIRLAVMKYSNLGKKMFQLTVCQKWIFWVLLSVILLGFPVSLTNQVAKLENAPTCKSRNKTNNIQAVVMESEYQVQDYYTVNVSSIGKYLLVISAVSRKERKYNGKREKQ